MNVISLILQQICEAPEYLVALKAAGTILAMGLPIYLGLRYFIYRRRLNVSVGLTLNFLSSFILFAGLAFLLASPMSVHLHSSIITGYLFLTCLVASFSVVLLVDVFLVQHYLTREKNAYVSPPLRAVIKLTVFICAVLPILRFVLHFNPLALIAIPTIATAGLALALQDTLKSFIAGVGLGQIVRLGEWIAFQDKEGRVVDINWARTVLETLDGQRVYIPNNLLQSGVFLNYSSGNPANRRCLKVSAEDSVPPAHVKEVLVRCAQSVTGVAASPAPQALLLEYQDSGICYGLYYWLERYGNHPMAQDDVATRVWYAFKREGIGIPYPVRTVQLRRAKDLVEANRTHIENSLQEWQLAEAFYGEELRELSFSTQRRLYAPGEDVVREGEGGDSLFTLVSGQADVLAGPGDAAPLATLKRGEIFGEMSLLTGAPRSATVRAKTSLEVLEINKAGLQKVLAKRPELSERLAELVSRRQAALAAAKAASGGAGQAPEPEGEKTLAKRIRHFFGLA
jgi:small-conductance mechanosensitive channel